MKSLEKIVETLIINGTLTDQPGLFYGKTGIAVFFFYYARHTGNELFQDYAMKLIEEIQKQHRWKLALALMDSFLTAFSYDILPKKELLNTIKYLKQMKANFLVPIFISILLTAACHQTKQTDFDLNLDFEKVNNKRPVNWVGGIGNPSGVSDNSNYAIYLDSTIVQSGKYSAVIEYIEGSPNFHSWALVLPNNYDGQEITLSGYIKTENVTDGFAGLWIRIDPQIAFDNMKNRWITGSTDWTKYEITLPMTPSRTEQIVLGGLLVGKGKMWLDNLKVTIDGKDIRKIKPLKPESFSEKAKNDRAFDKGSKIVFPELSEQKIEDLELLGKVWGFLKYHHPAIAKGDYNWDYELFKFLPAYLKANNNTQRDRILVKWINKYGKISICNTCQDTPDSAILKPNLSWIENSNMNLKLKNLLHRMYVNRNQGNHYYIKMRQGVGNPAFLNERTYEGMENPDAGFRLLALYRYWNMIYYFSPYRYLTDKDWNAILREYIPYFIEVTNKQDYRLTVTLLLAEVCDSHSCLFEEKATVESLNDDLQIPALLQFVENKLVVLEYYAKNAQLKKGDIITHINGKSVETIVDSVKKYFPASNEAAKMRDIAREILRFDRRKTYIRLNSGNNPYISINCISSDDKPEQKNIRLDSRSMWMFHRYRKEDTTQCYRLIDKDIGYITLKTIKNEDIPVIKKEFMNTKGIIIDIRNYPSTFVPFALGSYFVSKPAPFVKFTNGNANNPGEFTFTSALVIPKANETYEGKLVVIVNEDTQSSAEYTAMAFRAGDHTTIIGSQTAGADGNVSEIVLPGGLKTNISGIGVYYPDGRETQRVGIVPDVEVKPTIKGIREGRDEVLEKAIEIIKQESK